MRITKLRASLKNSPDRNVCTCRRKGGKKEEKEEEEEEEDKIKRIALSVYNLQAKRLIMKLIKPIRFSRLSFPFDFTCRAAGTMMKQLLYPIEKREHGLIDRSVDRASGNNIRLHALHAIKVLHGVPGSR